MSTDRLTTIFSALADPTRRAILARLSSGEASVLELAEPFDMSLPAVSKHLKVLANAGLITQRREAQWRPCRLEAAPLSEVADWVEHYRRFWEESFDRLDEYLTELQKEEKKVATVSMPATEPVIVFTRVFNAPRELVYEAWTDPKHVPNWFGPRGFTTTTYEMDVRPGGVWRFTMHGPDGVDYPNRVVFSEVVKPERLAYAHDGDEEGAAQFHVTITFEEQEGKTKLTMEQRFGSLAARDLTVAKYPAVEGGKQNLDRLGEYLAGLVG